MSRVTPEEVWKKMQEDAEFLQQPETVQEATRPYIEALPVILADLLDQPASLDNTMQAKVKFLRYCIENGYITAVVNAMPEEAFIFFSREDLPGMFEGMLSQLIDMLEELTGDVSALLKAQGVTEEEVMLGSNVGLNDEARLLYQSGSLTIGKLLVVQPMVIVKNTK